jgi:uncharacterized protein (DUF1778 family)
MKIKSIPEPTTTEVKDGLAKTETIHLRLTKIEKQDIRQTAQGLHLSITEYLLKCHAVVAAKLVAVP